MRARAAVVAIGLGACAADAASPVAVEVLAESQVVYVDATTSSATFDGRAVPVAGGIFVAGVDDDALWIDALTFEHGTLGLDLDGGGPGGGPWMASLAIRADAPLSFPGTMWSNDGSYALTELASTTAVMRWELFAPWPPMIEHDTDTTVTASASVITDETSVRLVLRGETEPVDWDWNDLHVRSKLRFTLEGSIARE